MDEEGAFSVFLMDGCVSEELAVELEMWGSTIRMHGAEPDNEMPDGVLFSSSAPLAKSSLRFVNSANNHLVNHHDSALHQNLVIWGAAGVRDDIVQGDPGFPDPYIDSDDVAFGHVIKRRNSDRKPYCPTHCTAPCGNEGYDQGYADYINKPQYGASVDFAVVALAAFSIFYTTGSSVFALSRRLKSVYVRLPLQVLGGALSQGLAPAIQLLFFNKRGCFRRLFINEFTRAYGTRQLSTDDPLLPISEGNNQ